MRWRAHCGMHDSSGLSEAAALALDLDHEGDRDGYRDGGRIFISGILPRERKAAELWSMGILAAMWK